MKSEKIQHKPIACKLTEFTRIDGPRMQSIATPGGRRYVSFLNKPIGIIVKQDVEFFENLSQFKKGGMSKKELAAKEKADKEAEEAETKRLNEEKQEKLNPSEPEAPKLSAAELAAQNPPEQPPEQPSGQPNPNGGQ